MTQFFLVRHGETIWNSEARIQGHLDSPLSKKGLEQVKLLCKNMKEKIFSAIYSSDLGRAYETARCFSTKNGLPILTKTCLRERNLGILQGEMKRELKTKFPEAFSCYKSDPDYVIPQGESLKQLRDRSLKCLEEIAEKHDGQRILVVTHNGVIISLFKHTLGLPIGGAPRGFLSLNTGVSVFSYENKTWMLEVWGAMPLS